MLGLWGCWASEACLNNCWFMLIFVIVLVVGAGVGYIVFFFRAYSRFLNEMPIGEVRFSIGRFSLFELA